LISVCSVSFTQRKKERKKEKKKKEKKKETKLSEVSVRTFTTAAVS
jgi:phage head maturation protease